MALDKVEEEDGERDPTPDEQKKIDGPGFGNQTYYFMSAKLLHLLSLHPVHTWGPSVCAVRCWRGHYGQFAGEKECKGGIREKYWSSLKFNVAMLDLQSICQTNIVSHQASFLTAISAWNVWTAPPPSESVHILNPESKDLHASFTTTFVCVTIIQSLTVYSS